MSRQWHWLAATLLLITTAACSRPGTEEPDCPTKITLPPGATPTTTLDPRCIVRATTTGTWAHPELPQRAFDLGAGQGTIRRSGDRAEGTFNSDMGGGTEFFLTWSLTMRN